MEYAIQILEKELEQLKKCLTEWDETHYPEARKERNRKVNDIESVLAIIINKSVCNCDFPQANSLDTFSKCLNCHRQIQIKCYYEPDNTTSMNCKNCGQPKINH